MDDNADDHFITVSIRRKTRDALKKVALSKEPVWKTIDRLLNEYKVSRLKRD